MKDLVPRIQRAFAESGWAKEAVTAEKWAELKVQKAELIALRLYTAPMFIFYNTSLRSMATDKPGRGAFAGMDVRGHFATTIHAINSGVLKLARLQPCCPIYRVMKLPAPFLEKSLHNIRSGVEFGFSSSTLDREVAVKYSRGAADKSSMIFEVQQGMFSRGAYIGWLSQYPEEKDPDPAAAGDRARR